MEENSFLNLTKELKSKRNLLKKDLQDNQKGNNCQRSFPNNPSNNRQIVSQDNSQSLSSGLQNNSRNTFQLTSKSTQNTSRKVENNSTSNPPPLNLALITKEYNNNNNRSLSNSNMSSEQLYVFLSFTTRLVLSLHSSLTHSFIH